jgi:hypothetical protein
MTDHGQWDDCPAGLVTKMAGELRARQFRAQRRPVIASVAILLILGVTWGIQSQIGVGSNPLTCAETVPLFADYHNDSLDASATARVAEHLANCPSCRKHFEDQFPGEARVTEDSGKLVAAQPRSLMIAVR